MGEHASAIDRRVLLRWLAAGSAGSLVFARALGQAAGAGRVSPEMIARAEWLAGLELEPADRELMVNGLNELAESFVRLRAVPLDNAVAPALIFRPLDEESRGRRVSVTAQASRAASTAKPSDPADLAFAGLAELSSWLERGELSSVELTRLSLERLSSADERLACVVTLTEDRALDQARRADAEIARGRRRGPLHGIPWGAKDLLAVRDYPTTWGARPYRDQRIEATASVVRRLDDAGAVLAAKLTLGALAWGDVWFGGTTHNPWKIEQGSSGSSAGSAAAVAAGLVPFALGSETWGSIVSPCSRCGVTGLRPTFGRVSREGAMALSWSMDKIGPLARSAEDCALVFAAIQGADGLDRSVVDHDFRWPFTRDVRTLRVGWVSELFEATAGDEDEEPEARVAAEEQRAADRATLDTLRALGIELRAIALPDRWRVSDLSFILSAEAAAAFDELTRSGRDDELERQVEQAWPNVFRQAQMIPAVEYLRANRIRTQLMHALEEALRGIDVFVAPSFAGEHLLMTNLTGHPAVVLPNGFRSDGTPTSITFTGRLHGEEAALALAHAFQLATDFHSRRPPGFDELAGDATGRG